MTEYEEICEGKSIAALEVELQYQYDLGYTEEDSFPQFIKNRIEALTGSIQYDIKFVGIDYWNRPGYKVQGKPESYFTEEELLHAAKKLEKAGCFSLILEAIPYNVAKKITESVKMPTIGIGAGPHCDGQVLVCYDMLGCTTGHKPKFVKGLNSIEGVDAVPGDANFILCHLSGKMPIAELQEKMLVKKIMIRNCNTFEGIGDRFFRVSLKDNKSNDYCLHMLEEILGQK